MRKVKKEHAARVVIHILVWAGLFVFPVFLVKKYRMAGDFLPTYYSLLAINALIFYTNYLVLVPGLFFKKRKYRYFASVLALVFCSYFISVFANDQIKNRISRNDSEEKSRQRVERLVPGQPPRRPGIIIAVPNARMIGYVSASFFMVFFSLGLRLLERQSENERLREEMDKAKLNAELAFLKNQISPHFFFNTLNNIYSLIDRSHEDSKTALIRLSKLMRYVLNERGQDFRLLNEEIEFMNNYIDLMRLRIGSRTKLDVSFPAECKNLKIPHLLFISLIENAFKYGISVQEESCINISLESGDNEILFKCENGLPEGSYATLQESAGVGLENLKKRLELLYPERHELEIKKTKDKFEVKLNIRLK